MSLKLKVGMLLVHKLDDEDYELYLIVSIVGNDIVCYYSGHFNHKTKYIQHINLNTLVKFCTRFAVAIYEI